MHGCRHVPERREKNAHVRASSERARRVRGDHVKAPLLRFVETTDSGPFVHEGFLRGLSPPGDEVRGLCFVQTAGRAGPGRAKKSVRAVSAYAVRHAGKQGAVRHDAGRLLEDRKEGNPRKCPGTDVKHPGGPPVMRTWAPLRADDPGWGRRELLVQAAAGAASRNGGAGSPQPDISISAGVGGNGRRGPG